MSNVPQGEVASSNTGSSSLRSGEGDTSNGEDGDNFNDHGKRFHYEGHGKSYDNDEKSGESDGLGENSENGGWSGTIGGRGSGGNSGSDGYGVPKSFHIVSNTDPQVHYTGLWVLQATDLSITHSTVVQGSTASLRFKGSAIGVFGTVPASSPKLEPPTVAYCLDSLPPYITTLPHATADMLNQPLYTSPNLSSNEEHLLVINVTKSMPRAPPYALAGFYLSPQSSSSQGIRSTATSITPPTAAPITPSTATLCTTTHPTTTPPTTIPPTTTPPTTIPMPTAAPPTATPTVPASATMSNGSLIGTVAGIVSCLLFVVIFGIIIFLVSRWRTHARRELSQQVCAETSSTRPETVYSNFTTSESILRHEPSIWDLTPSPVSSYEAPTTEVSRPGEILQPGDLLLPRDFAQPRAVRLSVMEFACPSLSSASIAALD